MATFNDLIHKQSVVWIYDNTQNLYFIYDREDDIAYVYNSLGEEIFEEINDEAVYIEEEEIYMSDVSDEEGYYSGEDE